ncbi:MAG: DUF4203 domain-containing protein [Lachnospiraceae bacterium]|nr:DUF4203 domain-containing protein [Lachnospiraceae bacterium]
MNSEMMEIMEMIEMLGTENILDMLVNSSEFQQIFSMVKGVITPFLIPILLMGVANCFFGYKIFRVLLAISTGLVGGVVGIVLGLACTDMNVAGAIFGFILGFALFGVLAWFLYQVFIFVQAFSTGFAFGFVVGSLLAKLQDFTLAIILGVVLGIALGVLVIVFERPVIMAITSFKGASSIALVLAFLIITNPTNFALWNGLLTVVFTIGGFLFQYFFKFGNAQAVPMKAAKVKTPKMNQPVMNQSGMQQPVMNQPVMRPTGAPVLLGIDGLYKGFEFDLNRTLLFGRDEERCNVLYPENANGISKIQFEVGINGDNGQVYVIDQYSTYGTNVNGHRLETNKAAFLNNGDIVMFGEGNVFKVTY